MRFFASFLAMLFMTVTAHAGDVVITIDDLPIAGKKLEVYMRTADVQVAAALTPGFNRTWHDVDFSKAKVTPDAINGPLTITINSDGWHPKEPLALNLAVVADLKSNKITVTQNDKPLVAAVKELPKYEGVNGRIVFDCQNVLSLDKPGKTHWATVAVSFGFHGVESVRIEPPGSLTDTSHAARIDGHKLTSEPRGINGKMNARIRLQGGEEKVAELALQTFVIGKRYFGTITQRNAGKDVGSGRVVGIVETPSTPGDFITLTLHDAIGPGAYIKLYVGRDDRNRFHAFATTPNFNNATHTVNTVPSPDDAGLLVGEVDITINPDPWQPKDGKPIKCRYLIHAKLTNGEYVGTYSSTGNDRTHKDSPLNGATHVAPSFPPVSRITFKLENALVGGNDWSNRVFITCDVKGEEITAGKLSNNHAKLDGAVRVGFVKIKDNVFDARLSANVTAGAPEGRYRFDLKGVVVGPWVAGTFTTIVDDKKAKTGTFWAGLAK